MALHAFSRTELLVGKPAMERLAQARVAVFGIGGVGGYTVEALARSGVGALDLIDDDRVCLTNINRQIYATRKTVGKYKVEVAKERILQINPACQVETHCAFYMPDTAAQFDFRQYDYVVDAIDTVTDKLEMIEQAYRAGTPIISSMGAGNKMDPTAFEVAGIYETSVCPLAKVMRHELRKRGIPKLRQYRTKSVWRLCTPSACKFPFRACFVSSRTHLACIFSEIFRENTRKSTKDFLRFSLHLSKNLTTQSAYVRYETDSHISQKCS